MTDRESAFPACLEPEESSIGAAPCAPRPDVTRQGPEIPGASRFFARDTGHTPTCALHHRLASHLPQDWA